MTEPKAILITGAARRIGRHMALRLAADGYDIALHYNGSLDDAKRTAAEIEALGQQAVLLQADLGDNPDYEGIITQAKQALPHLCGLVHNASIFAPSPFVKSDEKTFDANFQLHVKAPFFLSQAYAKQIGKGSIISILDTNVTGHASVHFTYLASKKALAELTQMLARELAPTIRVNAIAPGLTSLSDDVSPEQAAAKAKTLPLGIIAQPEQIADAAAYLLQADYLVGHVLHIDGGQKLL
jgi:pteridine reductase